jgi:hypothetical protein
MSRTKLLRILLKFYILYDFQFELQGYFDTKTSSITGIIIL